MLTVEIAVAKTNKYASGESGDSVEVVERPGGGLSAVVVDGQGSGQAAKSLSMLVTSRVVSMLTDGVRDEAAAMGAHDFLFAYRHGKVSATLDIITANLPGRAVTVLRHSPLAFLSRDDGAVTALSSESHPIGRYRNSRPSTYEFALEDGLRLMIYTDGVSSAGASVGTPFDPSVWQPLSTPIAAGARELADGLLYAAMDADQGRPRDDMTVLALAVREIDAASEIRRMCVSMPCRL